MKTTHTLYGQTFELDTRYNYVAVLVRPEAYTTADGTYVAFASTTKHSNSLEAATKAAKNDPASGQLGMFSLVMSIGNRNVDSRRGIIESFNLRTAAVENHNNVGSFS